MNRKKVFIVVTNDLVTDQRVHKIATTLHREIGDVCLVGRKMRGSKPLDREYKTHRLQLIFKKSALFYLEYNLRLFLYLLFRKADIIVANDLDTLLASYVSSVVKSSKLVYDSHEYFTELPELVHRPFIRNVWLKLEQIILPRIKSSYTVCHSIANVYEEKYGINMGVVRNAPLKQKFNIDATLFNPKIIIYQGAINIGRGIEEAVYAMKYIKDAVLWIYGAGDIENEVKSLIKSEGLQKKVILKGRLPFEKLHEQTQCASLGLCVEKGEEMGLSYYFALPNKLFDYIQAGIPVIVNDLPEKRRIIDEYGVGFILETYEPKHMGNQINKILNNDASISTEIFDNAAKELCWENEEKSLLSIYSSL